MHPPLTSRDRGSNGASGLDGLVDEMLLHYIDWRREARAVAEAYRQWSDAPAGEKAARFSAYMTALDREEATATKYARVTREVETAAQAA